ncbi:MAG TPA: aminotransferase class IV [Patescibacteria group bacterium]|nr:aminotransferase class IV [Patescibacteria group bacterium]
MKYRYFSANGKLLPIEQAVISIANIEYQYGFGVYEALRVVRGKPYFISQHCNRLLASAKIISLEHSFSPVFIQESIIGLITKNKVETCNIKVILVGGLTPADAKLYILCLVPLFPDRKLYMQGAHFITCEHVRDYPHAKTLNMLPSYLAYRQAKQQRAYDALLINPAGYITEGTRTNFLCLKGQTITSPPEEQILPGIMRAAVLDYAQKNGFKVAHKPIHLDDLDQYEAAFVTSTSSKILPAKSIDGYVFGSSSTSLSTLMKQFSNYLKNLN